MAGSDVGDDMRAALQSAERAARDQQFNIEHVAALLVLLAQDSGGQCPGHPTQDGAEMDRRWLRVEYLAAVIAGHVAALAVALDGVNDIKDRIGRAAA